MIQNPSNSEFHPIRVRKSGDRGHTSHGWLKSAHSFSFGEYYDPNHMGFRSLRVINQDRVAPGSGFPTHSHRDMEIFSYVLDGAMKHQDSMGNGRLLHPGQIQLMSAGTGLSHSEFNPSESDPLHFLQVWIAPRSVGLIPSYTEWHAYSGSEFQPKILLISPDGRDHSALIHQDAEVYRIRLSASESVGHKLRSGRGLWLQVVHGPVTLNDVLLSSGDGAHTEEGGRFAIRAAGEEPVEALLFDLGQTEA